MIEKASNISKKFPCPNCKAPVRNIYQKNGLMMGMVDTKSRTDEERRTVYNEHIYSDRPVHIVDNTIWKTR